MRIILYYELIILLAYRDPRTVQIFVHVNVYLLFVWVFSTYTYIYTYHSFTKII
jgi:hypothetical protein